MFICRKSRVNLVFTYKNMCQLLGTNSNVPKVRRIDCFCHSNFSSKVSMASGFRFWIRWQLPCEKAMPPPVLWIILAFLGFDWETQWSFLTLPCPVVKRGSLTPTSHAADKGKSTHPIHAPKPGTHATFRPMGGNRITGEFGSYFWTKIKSLGVN